MSVTQAGYLPPPGVPAFREDNAEFKSPLLVPFDEESPLGKVPQDALEPGADADGGPVFESEAESFLAAETVGALPSFDDTPDPESSESSDSASGAPADDPQESAESPEEELLEIPVPDEPEDQGLPNLWNESSMDWVLPDGSNGIGFFSLTADTPSWEFDLSSEEKDLNVDFGAAIHFVSGPSRSDLPPRLYDIFWNASFRSEIADGIGVDVNFKLGLFTDFEDSVRKGWRFPGRALGYADIETHRGTIGRVVAGIEYLDLEQTEILPAGGMILEPDEDTRLDLYFPRPQVRFRIDQADSEDRWLYFRGEYHTSAWAIERATGNGDVVAFTEFRATVGLETVPNSTDGSSSFFEFGYIFNRDLEYRSSLGNFQPDDTVVFRMGGRY